jgi:hypothetical protein
MFDDEDEGVNVLIDYTHTVSIVRMLGNAIIPARLTIKAQVLPSDQADPLDFDVTFAKVKFWFETVVARAVIFGRENKPALEMFTDETGRSRVVNYLMITPSEPTDEHLGALFQSKMSALSGGMMEIGVVRVNSESQTGLVWSYVGDWQQDLPTMENWFSTKPYYFDKPWWARDDSSTIDMIAEGVTEFSQIPSWAFTLDFIERAIRPKPGEDGSEPESASESLENIVIRGTFRPKVIDGGEANE